MKRLILLMALAITAVAPGGAAQAHKPGDSYLALTVEDDRLTGKWDIALRDLEHAIGLDRNGDRAITWGEVRARHDEIAAHALARVTIGSGSGVCTLAPAEQLIEEHGDGRYASLAFVGACPTMIETLDLTYNLMFDLDALHRGLISVQAGAVIQSRVLGPDGNHVRFDIQTPDLLAQSFGYVEEGIWHIWLGPDHLLFLVTLLMGTLVRRTKDGWRIEPSARRALVAILGIVTAFTLAHSLTLSLAVLKLVSLPSRLVEVLIATSIILAALNNLYPLVTRRLWLLALGFGLIHGFGFAGALSELGLPSSALALSLLSFNIGVEIGQLVVVGLFMLTVLAARTIRVDWAPVAAFGQLAVVTIGAVWLAERVAITLLG
jgi:hypothetical protein